MTTVRSMRQRPGLKLPILLLGVVIVAAAVVGLAVQLRATTWTATSQVIYGSGGTDALLGTTAADADVTRTLATQAEVILGDEVMGNAAEELEVPQRDLVDATTVEAVPDTNVLSISVESDDASDAQRRTQVVTDLYVEQTRATAQESLEGQASALDGPVASLQEQAATLSQTGGGGAQLGAVETTLADLQQQQLRLQSAADAEQGPVQLLSEATEPPQPSSTSPQTGILLGAGAGLVLAIGIFLVLDWARRNQSTTSRPA